jgi:hypothetical protein
MPETTAMIAVLILERPMCPDCIATRANASLNEIEAAFLPIARALHLERFASERCRACGNTGLAFSVTRPAN